jgi:hypothetical protein
MLGENPRRHDSAGQSSHLKDAPEVVAVATRKERRGELRHEQNEAELFCQQLLARRAGRNDPSKFLLGVPLDPVQHKEHRRGCPSLDGFGKIGKDLPRPSEARVNWLHPQCWRAQKTIFGTSNVGSFSPASARSDQQPGQQTNRRPRPARAVASRARHGACSSLLTAVLQRG